MDGPAGVRACGCLLNISNDSYRVDRVFKRVTTFCFVNKLALDSGISRIWYLRHTIRSIVEVILIETKMY